MPGLRLATAWLDDADALVAAGPAVEELEVAVAVAADRERTGSGNSFHRIEDMGNPPYRPLVGSSHVRPVLLRWRNGSESIGLFCVPPPESELWLRPQNPAFDAFSIRDDRARRVLFRRCRTGGGMLIELFNRNTGEGPTSRTWFRSPPVTNTFTLSPPGVTIFKPLLLVTVQFMQVSAAEAQAMDARCPGPDSNGSVPVDQALLPW